MITNNPKEVLFIFLWILGILGAVGVTTTKNTVHSAFFLVWTFFNTVVMLLLFQIEFLAFMLLVVYVGAITVLFLFVVMMFDTKPENMYHGRTYSYPKKYRWILYPLLFLWVCVAADIIYIWAGAISFRDIFCNIKFCSLTDAYTRMEQIGDILYTNYFMHFILCGLILLISMLGAISLTLQMDTKLNSQDLFEQVAQDVSTSIRLN